MQYIIILHYYNHLCYIQVPISILIGLSMLFMSLIMPSSKLMLNMLNAWLVALILNMNKFVVLSPCHLSLSLIFLISLSLISLLSSLSLSSLCLSSLCLSSLCLSSLSLISLSLISLLSSLSLSPSAANPAFQLLYILFWSFAVILTVAYLYNHGEEFVNQPKLIKSD